MVQKYFNDRHNLSSRLKKKPSWLRKSNFVTAAQSATEQSQKVKRTDKNNKRCRDYSQNCAFRNLKLCGRVTRKISPIWMVGKSMLTCRQKQFS